MNSTKDFQKYFKKLGYKVDTFAESTVGWWYEVFKGKKLILSIIIGNNVDDMVKYIIDNPIIKPGNGKVIVYNRCKGDFKVLRDKIVKFENSKNIK